MPETKTPEETLDERIEDVIAGYDPTRIRTDDDIVDDFYSTCQVIDMLKAHGTAESRSTAIGFAEWTKKMCFIDTRKGYTFNSNPEQTFTIDRAYQFYLDDLLSLTNQNKGG